MNKKELITDLIKIADALEKSSTQRPLEYKPTESDTRSVVVKIYFCPVCKKIVRKTNYCPNCGQKLGWEMVT